MPAMNSTSAAVKEFRRLSASATGSGVATAPAVSLAGGLTAGGGVEPAHAPARIATATSFATMPRVSAALLLNGKDETYRPESVIGASGACHRFPLRADLADDKHGLSRNGLDPSRIGWIRVVEVGRWSAAFEPCRDVRRHRLHRPPVEVVAEIADGEARGRKRLAV